jgi:hypothetical protein
MKKLSLSLPEDSSTRLNLTTTDPTKRSKK